MFQCLLYPRVPKSIRIRKESVDASPQVSIVDDDPFVRRALGRLCEVAGYGVELYASAEEFLQRTHADNTSCLILDVHLPGRSGLQLQSDLQAAGRRFPIVFVTAFEDEQTRNQALQTGAVAFLQKPLDNERLLGVIHNLLTQDRTRVARTPD
ncbi:two-component system response regulator [Rhodopirellula sp. SM50]|nr:two-component system response regulator [Rhodopirellula sp. SM50]